MNDAKNDVTGPTGADRGGGVGALRGVGIGCGLLVAVPVLVALGFLTTFAVQRGTPEDYERVDPQAMMTRIGDVSQEAYEVLGFERTVPPGWVDPADPSASETGSNTADSALCYPDGLESMADEPVDGAYSLSHKWSLGGVAESEASSALKRLHGHLKEEGWDIDSYENGPEAASGLGLRASRNGPSDDGGDIRLVFDWRDHQEVFEGGVHAPCAYAPEAKPGTDVATEAGETVEPAELRPAG
ncbi:hypothetical protein OG292_23590 [Streptomyces sp. NBC_01511]|uniref:hypothetical protein n=1 Tax=unclassified Streptomyces TaxID=2593676 RepID=UPI00386B2130